MTLELADGRQFTMAHTSQGWGANAISTTYKTIAGLAAAIMHKYAPGETITSY